MAVYDVRAVRSGEWWAIEIVAGLPPYMLGVSQARNVEDVEDVARALVVDLLEVDPADVELNVSIEIPFADPADDASS